ncbi:hypothetical protein [Mucilaginibacter agri]|uniref:Long-chain fatty acid transport protein n=1 Tax=Mucilaginibacter agri TaxID=2695265 RepID=A0A966DRF7_9SPHI|nr:hypothetical protein [Mucilaginibacter agri]NCD68440.1 hypothetical protein [Mucilaginibacter agri]
MAKLYFARIIFLSVFLGFVLNETKAQDTNYWSSEYGPAGFLTPGAAVAFTRDSGVLYYNPALLGYNTKSTASISGSIYQLNSIKIKNGAGPGYNLNSSGAAIIPVAASGIFAFKGKKKFTIAYAIIHNPVLGYQASQQRDDKFNVLNDAYSPGNEVFIGQFDNQNTINETSGSLSTGFKLSKNLAVGFSTELLFRRQFYQSNQSTRVEINTPTTLGIPPLSDVESLYQTSYNYLGLRFKAGVAYNMERHHFGLNISSPLARLYGKADLLSNTFISNLIFANSDTANLLASTKQSKLKATYKMPVSIAAGYAYDTGWGQVYLSAEYFNSLAEYNIITPKNKPFIRDDGPADDPFTSSFLKSIDGRKSITNFGVGVSYNVNATLTGYVSARTDFTYAQKQEDIDADGYLPRTSYFNNYHGQIGANIKKRKFNLRTGLLLTYGHTNNYPQPINFSNPNENNYLTGNTTLTAQSFFGVGLMFAYIYNL